MNNVILLDEIRIKKEIQQAEHALRQARTLVSLGEKVSPDVIPRLEQIIEHLEQKLISILENTNG